MQLPLIRKVETSITNIENYFTQQRRANGQDDKQIKAAQGMLDILKMRYWQLIEEQNTAADELKEQFETTINTLNNIIQDLYVSIIITGNETEEYLERQATANQNLANYIKDFPVINDKDQLATLSHELRYQTAVKRLAQHKMNADDPKTNLVRGLVKESNYLKKNCHP